MIFVAIVLFCAIISPGVLLFMLPLLCVLRSQLSMIAIQQIQTASFYPIPWISSSQFIRHLACEILRLLCLGVWAILAYLSLLIWVSLAVRAEWDDLLVFCGLSSTLVAITMPFVYLFVRLWFVVPLLLDGHAELDSAMAESFRLTRGHALALGGYIAILTSLILLGVACLGVGLLVVAPFVLLAEASAYLHATGQVPRAKITP
jgi:uncharacterized membrane protein